MYITIDIGNYEAKTQLQYIQEIINKLLDELDFETHSKRFQ